MNDDFVVERIALHLVDRTLPGPRLSDHGIDLDSYDSVDDVQALTNFFNGHLEKIWEAQEGLRTRAANFQDRSTIQECYQAILLDPLCFFERSRLMAQRLYDESRGLRTTRGLLLVLWIRQPDVPRPFLVLLKLEPGPSNKITLSQDNAGATLLDLVVEHLEQALPDPGDRILKWAVMPHPSRTAYQLKVKDDEGGSDLAQYFVTFLECEPRLNEKQQTRALLEALPEYAEECHPDTDWQTSVEEVIAALDNEPVITADVLMSKVQELGVFPEFNSNVLQEKLRERHADDMQVRSGTLGSVKLRYTLPSGITIEGPRMIMESLVQIERVGEEYEFNIRAPRYERRLI